MEKFLIVRKGGEADGPYDVDTIKAMLCSGQVSSDDFYWNGGEQKLLPLSGLVQLQPHHTTNKSSTVPPSPRTVSRLGKPVVDHVKKMPSRPVEKSSTAPPSPRTVSRLGKPVVGHVKKMPPSPVEKSSTVPSSPRTVTRLGKPVVGHVKKMPSSPVEVTYFVALPGQGSRGPFSREEVQNNFNMGHYPLGTMVWVESTETWVPIHQLFQPGNGNMGYPMANGAYGGNAYMPQKRPGWNPISGFTSCMKRYVMFDGRSSRAEYWMSVLSFILCFLILAWPYSALTEEFLYYDEEVVAWQLGVIVYLLVWLLPLLSVKIRRLHDRGLSGWWCLIILVPYLGSIVDFVLMCLPSTPTSNQYGVQPLPPA